MQPSSCPRAGCGRYVHTYVRDYKYFLGSRQGEPPTVARTTEYNGQVRELEPELEKGPRVRALQRTETRDQPTGNKKKKKGDTSARRGPGETGLTG
jgi:hypothetical protein